MHIAERLYRKITRELQYTRRDASHLIGADNSFYSEAHGIRIMIYHGVSPQNYSRFNPIFLKLKTFEEHLIFYKKHFNMVSMDDVYTGRVSKSRFNICLTFDDGFANNNKYVLPLLKQYNVPANFFVTGIQDAGYDVLWNDYLNIVSQKAPATLGYNNETYEKTRYNRYVSTASGITLTQQLRTTGFAEKMQLLERLYTYEPFMDNGFNEDYWLQMNPEQIREMAACPLVTIGAHGYYHNDLAQIPLADAAGEMQKSKQYLENIIQKPVTSLAFPYGSYTPEVVEQAKKIGYTQLLAMDFKYEADNNDLAMKPRFTINPYISTANQMHATVKGTYGL